LWSLLCSVSAQQLAIPLLSYSCLQLLWPCTDFCQVSCYFLVYRNVSACLIDKYLFFWRSPGTPPLAIFFSKFRQSWTKLMRHLTVVWFCVSYCYTVTCLPVTLTKTCFFSFSGYPSPCNFFFKIQTILDKINETPRLTPLPPQSMLRKGVYLH